MQKLEMVELNQMEVEQVSGGIPVPILVVGAIVVVGFAMGVYHGYQPATKQK